MKNRGIVEVDEDVFIDMLWDRVENGYFDNPFDDEFWKEAFELLSESEWLSVQHNDPKYIVDNIIVNGEIFSIDEISEDGERSDIYQKVQDEYEGDIDEWISDNAMRVGDYVVLNWGI